MLRPRFLAALLTAALAFTAAAAADDSAPRRSDRNVMPSRTPPASAQPGAAPAQPAVPDEEKQLVQKGKSLYGTNCIHCHGINMVTPGTGAFDLRQFPHDDKARFVSSVTNGKNNRMPPWGDILKREEIDALWAYVLTGGKG